MYSEPLYAQWQPSRLKKWSQCNVPKPQFLQWMLTPKSQSLPMLQSPTLKTCLQPATKTVLVSKEANVSLYFKKKKLLKDYSPLQLPVKMLKCH